MSRRRTQVAGQSSPPAKAAAHGDGAVGTVGDVVRRHGMAFAMSVMIGLVLIRCVVPLSPNLYWDTDPRQPDASQVTAEGEEIMPLSFGPAGAAWLDALTIAAAGIVMAVHVLLGGRVRWLYVALALPAFVIAWLHAGRHIDNLYILGGWLSGVSVALAALHAAELPAIRKFAVAALLAMAVPLAIDGGTYVYDEHPDSVAFFKEHEQGWLAAKGWEKGSPEHEIYLRRLEQPEAFGAFTFSNIFGSVNAALAMLAMGVSAGMLLRRQMRQGPIALPALLAIAACMGVIFSHSRGAMLAMVLAATIVVWLLVTSDRARLRRLIAPLVITLIALAFITVIARGMIGPPRDAAGERSLLFRWHYWQASARIATESPGNMLTGIGPAAFQDDYARLKNPINPEEVRSAHNVFIDQIVDLGIAGWLLAGMLILLLLRAANGAANTTSVAQEDAQSPQGEGDDVKSQAALQIELVDMFKVVVLMAIVFGTEFAVRGAVLQTPERFLAWSCGPIAVLFIASLLVARDWLDERSARFGLLAAATLLLVHNQIEMTFFQPNSTPLAWLIVALAAAGAKSDAVSKPSLPPAARWLPAAALLFFAVLLAAIHAAPLSREQSLLAEAQRVLRRDPNTRPALDRTLELLQEARQAYAVDPKPYDWESRLAVQAAGTVRMMMDSDRSPQVRLRAEEIIWQYLARAFAALDAARDAGLDSVAFLRLRAQLTIAAHRFTGQPGPPNDAIALYEELLKHSPYTPSDRIDLGNLLRQAGRREEAAAQYREALRLSDQMYLDPLRQMTKQDRQRVEAMIKKVAP